MSELRGFIGGSYVAQNRAMDVEQCVNWFMETSGSESSTTASSLIPAPGFEAKVTVSAVGCRAAFSTQASGGRTFTIVGDTLYEIDLSFVATVRGTVAVDANPATISWNGDGGDQLFITSGGLGYCYELSTNVLTAIPGLAATQGDMLDGWFIAFDVVLGRMRISDLLDGQVWDPTQFADRSIAPDPWRAMIVTDYGQILLPGSQTGEYWFDAGTFPFPFEPVRGSLFVVGIAATFSLTQVKGASCWLATSENGGYQIVAATGYTPERISTDALDYQLSQYSRLDDAFCDTYEEAGHAFFYITFPSALKSHFYDFATGLWHDRGLWDSSLSRFVEWRPSFHCFAFNQHLVGDRLTGVLYQMSSNFPLDVDGQEMRRMRRYPAPFSEHRRQFYPHFELYMQTGVGTVSGQGEDPHIVLRVSNDGGNSWSNQLPASVGKLGQYGLRVQWHRLGMARERVYEVFCSDPVPYRIAGAYQRVRQSTEAA